MRYELKEFEWSSIRPFLPKKSRGLPRVSDRHVLNRIFWILRSGAPWRDLPEGLVSYTTCYNRFVRWRAAGIRDFIMEALAKIDTSIVRYFIALVKLASIRIWLRAYDSTPWQKRFLLDGRQPPESGRAIFRNDFMAICPVHPRWQKYSASPLTQINSRSAAVSTHRGADRASSRTRDGMRWTRQRRHERQSQGGLRPVSDRPACGRTAL
jgi:transposase